MRWLLCENHHGKMYGISAEVIATINRNKA
jgi:hypothetical protein